MTSKVVQMDLTSGSICMTLPKVYSFNFLLLAGCCKDLIGKYFRFQVVSLEILFIKFESQIVNKFNLDFTLTFFLINFLFNVF